jgi:hypothetical protein
VSNVVDLTGKKFGRLSIISRADNSKAGKSRWNCQCECGNYVTVLGASLIRGVTLSCGCYHDEVMHETSLDLIGSKFARLTVIGKVYTGRNNWLKWKCICDCGNIVEVKTDALKSGKTKSCGCYNLDRITKHGMYKTREFSIWRCIKDRCYNSNKDSYKYYGGRGITMSDEWKNSFMNFYRDMGKSPTHLHSIDRIDVNDNYSKDNCRWATPKQQANNTTRNIKIKYMGETRTLKQWAEAIGIQYQTLQYRYYAGKTVEELFLPVQKKFRSKSCISK